MNDQWFGEHQQLLGALKAFVGWLLPGLLYLALRPRTPEQFDAMPPWLSRGLKVVGAIFGNAPAVALALREPLPAPEYRRRTDRPPPTIPTITCPPPAPPSEPPEKP